MQRLPHPPQVDPLVQGQIIGLKRVAAALQGGQVQEFHRIAVEVAGFLFRAILTGPGQPGVAIFLVAPLLLGGGAETLPQGGKVVIYFPAATPRTDEVIAAGGWRKTWMTNHSSRSGAYSSSHARHSA